MLKANFIQQKTWDFQATSCTRSPNEEIQAEWDEYKKALNFGRFPFSKFRN
jgi:hypothetical protein